MNKKSNYTYSCIFLIMILLVSENMIAQTLERSVISNAGDYNSQTSGSISWTLGELTIETYTENSISIAQGFQQYYLTVVPTNYAQPINTKIYPNPATVQISVESDKLKSITLFDANGSIVYHQESASNLDHQTVDIAHFPDGIYFISIATKNSPTKQVFKIIKTGK